MDTNANSAPPQKPWALWAALTLVGLGAIALVYVLLIASGKPETQQGLSRFAQGEMARLYVEEAPPPMPTRTLRDAAGNETTLTAYQGQVVVLNLWATWCAPCMEEMPSLAVLQRNFEGRIAVVPISVDSEGERAKAISDLQRLSGGSLPFLQDMTRGVLFDAQAAGMPVTIIYNRQGQEVARLAGGANWGSEDASRVIEAVLAEE
ncbi:MAG: TlpA disulfide reductase family protein [Alphaproteobacteria bacterium]|nr:TlpA disulfide reductase family protein [Alphaproteobacteria bacterium]